MLHMQCVAVGRGLTNFLLLNVLINKLSYLLLKFFHFLVFSGLLEIHF